jgi:hypothetical protein
MDALREKKAIHAARRAYKSAMALGAEERIALDVVRLPRSTSKPEWSGDRKGCCCQTRQRSDGRLGRINALLCVTSKA